MFTTYLMLNNRYKYCDVAHVRTDYGRAFFSSPPGSAVSAKLNVRNFCSLRKQKLHPRWQVEFLSVNLENSEWILN